MYIHTYTCIHIYIYTYTCIHTYTYIYTQIHIYIQTKLYVSIPLSRWNSNKQQMATTHTAAQGCLMRLPAAPLQPDHLLLLRMRYLRRAQPDPGCPQPAQVRSRRQPLSLHARLRRRRRSHPDSLPCSAQLSPHERMRRNTRWLVCAGVERARGGKVCVPTVQRGGREGGRHACRSRDEIRSTCERCANCIETCPPSLEAETNCLRRGF